MREPKCPICSRDMLLITYPVKLMYGAKYRCCGWTSPAKMGGTKEEAIKHARAAAMKRKLQKPLTLDEIAKAGVVWLEDNDKEDIIPAIVGYVIDHEIVLHSVHCSFVSYLDEYGIRWRAWASDPTIEEREAAPWEE